MTPDAKAAELQQVMNQLRPWGMWWVTYLPAEDASRYEQTGAQLSIAVQRGTVIIDLHRLWRPWAEVRDLDIAALADDIAKDVDAKGWLD